MSGQPELVWARERDPADFHLMRRRGNHHAICGHEMRFATTRYFEGLPLPATDKVCGPCLSVAQGQGLTYP